MSKNKFGGRLYGVLCGLLYLTQSFSLVPSAPPYHITADHAAFFRDQHNSVFTGHVVATQGDSKMTGTQLTLHLDSLNKNILYWILVGDTAVYTTYLKNKKEQLTVQADIIRYYPLTRVAIFEKNVNVTSGQNRVTGSYIVYDLKRQMVKSKVRGLPLQKTIIIKPE